TTITTITTGSLGLGGAHRLQPGRSLCQKGWKKPRAAVPKIPEGAASPGVALSDPEEREELWDLRERNRLDTSPEDWELLSSLRGTYYLNGLASVKVGSRLVHPFEAHGFLRSIEFHGDGMATYRASYVHTLCESLERSVKTPLFRGVFSNVVDFDSPLGLLNSISPGTRDTANLACRFWPPPGQTPATSSRSPQLIASGDNGTPMVLDPRTLSSQGALDFEGLGGRKWLAHTRYDAACGRVVFASCTFEPSLEGGMSTRLDFREYDTQGVLVAETSHTTGFMVMHDWIITPNFYVVPKNPAKLDPAGLAQFLAGLAQGTKVFNMEEDISSSVLLIPRVVGTGEAQEVQFDRFLNIFHVCPTWEEEADGKLIMHAVAFDSYEFGREMGFDVKLQDFDPIKWSAGERNPAPRLHRFTPPGRKSSILARVAVVVVVVVVVDIVECV
ncbi:unnamed protein product, partial [Polarella glacialis]